MINSIKNENQLLIQIGREDVYWNYAATFLKIASSALLLPFILRMMSSEMVGIWVVFMTITAFATLLDFGFSGSFTRNITYVFSGVGKLKKEGFEKITIKNQEVDFSLLRGVIYSMKWFYLRMSIVLFIILITIGTYYISNLLKNYSGETQNVYISWIILCVISTYNLYTLYYDSLLQGKGLVKRSKQIVIVGQTFYLLTATILIINGYDLIAIVSAQALSVIVIRWLSYHSFFTPEIRQKLDAEIPKSQNEILKAITPNAIKIGLTSLGSFMVTRSAIVIGSLHLTLNEIASYGITMQLIGVIAGLATIYTKTFQPSIAQLQVINNKEAIKQIYLTGQIILLVTFILGGIGLLVMEGWAIEFIGSKTKLMPTILIIVATIISFLENNHAVAGGILLTENKVPFFKASLFSGGLTILLMILIFQFTNLGLWAMILSPGIAQGLYQNWKWPIEVIKDLNITTKDFAYSLNIFNKAILFIIRK